MTMTESLVCMFFGINSLRLGSISAAGCLRS
jgi:hypothetical protein